MSSRHNRFRPARRAPALAASALAVAAAAACGGRDPYAPVAQTSTVGPQSLTLVPLSRVRAPFYPALDLRFAEPVQPTVGLTTTGIVPNFDLAFDVDSAGRILLLPAKLVVSTTIVPRTAFQTSSTKFDSLGAAPGGTYQADSILRVTVGQTVVVQAQSTLCLATGTFFYAKLVVDSVYSTTGALAVRVVSDPNCGFKSFASGIPTS